ncbi:MAG: twin-arginine translocase TatA/TatE family subunit [Pseudomonadota bacterium]
MGTLSIWHWLIVAIVIMLLFGKGRISEMMGDLAKGIKSFKSGLAEDEPGTQTTPTAQVEARPATPAQPATGTATTPADPAASASGEGR